MRHAQLVEGIQRVIEALESSGLREALAPEKPDAEKLLESLRRYAIAAASFRAHETSVVGMLGLAELDSSVVWARLLTGGPARTHYHDRIGFVSDHLPRFVELFEEARRGIDHESALRVVVLGDGRLGLSQRKLITVVSSLGVLYRSASVIHGLAEGELSLVSLECGHDTHLVFDGTPRGIGYVKDLLLATYRWLSLYRDEKVEDRLQLAKDALPIGRALESLSKRGGIKPEEAKRTEHNALLALFAFFDVGALIPEMDGDVGASPRQLAASARGRADDGEAAIELDDVADEIASLTEAPGDDEEAPLRDSVIVLDDDESLQLSDADDGLEPTDAGPVSGDVDLPQGDDQAAI